MILKPSGLGIAWQLLIVLSSVTAGAGSAPAPISDAAMDHAANESPAVTDGYLTQFDWAIKQGWTIGMARVLDVSDKVTPQSATTAVSGGISAHDRHLLNLCYGIDDETMPEGAASIGVHRGNPRLLDIEKLQQVLSQNPHFFFAEYGIALAHDSAGDPAGYRKWMDEALKDAPAIIAGRCQFQDQTPIDGFTLARSVRFFRTAIRNESAELQLVYPVIRTDSNGCFYIPVFAEACEVRAIRPADNGAPPTPTGERAASLLRRRPQAEILEETVDAENALTHRVAFSARVGVLPPDTIPPHQEQLRFDAPFDTAMGRDRKHPVTVDNDVLHVSWKPYPGAASYRLGITEVRLFLTGPHSTTYSESALAPFTGDNYRMRETHVEIPLNGNQPIFHRQRGYGFYLQAFDGDGNILRTSLHYFEPIKGIASLPPDKDSIKRMLPPGARLISFKLSARDLEVTGLRPPKLDMIDWARRELFDCKYHDYEEQPNDSKSGGTDAAGGLRRFRVRWYVNRSANILDESGT